MFIWRCCCNFRCNRSKTSVPSINSPRSASANPTSISRRKSAYLTCSEASLNVLGDVEPDAFNQILQEFPRFVGLNEKDFHSTRKLDNNAFIEVNLSAQDIYSFCMKAIETAEISVEEWCVET